jgi:hypothetical protein
MAQFAAPILRGGFLYSSILYTDGGEHNYHSRATIEELTALLRPGAPKPDKRLKIQRPPDILKDQKGHWYTAQLIHYGLPVTKDKNAAKVRLLEALNERRLEVPAWVKKLEGELKKEWDSENRKLKKAAKSAAVTISPLPKQPKGTTRNSAQFQPSPQPSQRKRKRDDNWMSNMDDGNKKTKRNETVPRLDSRLPRYSTSHVKIEITKTEPISQFPFKSEPEGYYYDPPLNLTLTGTYRVTCPSMSDMFAQHGPRNLHLTLLQDEDRGVWWASFSWWSWDCIIQMNPGPSYETLGQPCTLGWRLRDHDTGRMHFGRGKTGNITFNRDQTMDGVLVNMPFLGTLEFWGRRIPGPKYVERSGHAFQLEWDTFVNAAYW